MRMRGAQNNSSRGRLNRRVKSPALVGFATLAALTQCTADDSGSGELYPYIGCFKDTRRRVLVKQLPVNPLTLVGCASACLNDVDPSWKFAGLEFGQEW